MTILFASVGGFCLGTFVVQMAFGHHVVAAVALVGVIVSAVMYQIVREPSP